MKNLALLAFITNDQSETSIHKLVTNLGMEDIGNVHPLDIHNPSNYLVFLNGLVIGIHNNPSQFLVSLRKLRRRGLLDEFVSIYGDYKKKIIFISSDYGRLCRPLIIVEKGIPLVTQSDIEDVFANSKGLKDLIAEGKIEFLDVNEEDDAFIALNNDELKAEHTHLEIAPFTILGAVAGVIPFPHHNQSPRNTYQCAMGKQAIGVVGYNNSLRVDTLLYNLIYPQAPLVRTKTMDIINYDKLPAGHNASVAGYDIEDAIVLNKASLDRGFGRISVYRRYTTEFKRFPIGIMESIKKPQPPADDSKRSEFIKKRQAALGEDGLAGVGTSIENGQIYVNKIIPNITQELMNSFEKVKVDDIQWIDCPSIYKGTSVNRVDKTVLRESRVPEVGDKLSSRHGQKGVCGLIVSQEDMPFDERGWCPDLIMNPHGFPSRMTVGKMIELLAAKSGTMKGEYKYGTAFGGDRVEDICKELIEYGFSYNGRDCLISGITGEYMNCYVFCGPIYYQRLKHMVSDKIHARARGPTTTLTRQPTEGRAREGGLRLGEMERDCLIGYGATNLLLERLMISSDQFEVFVCEKCGMMKHSNVCKVCEDSQVYKIKLPYACKLLFQELISMNIKPIIRLKDK